MGRPQMKVWSMIITRCVFKATKTHSEQFYAIFIDFPQHSGCANAP